MNGHKIVNQNALHYLTFTIVGWVDIFTRKRFKEVIIESLNFCSANKGLKIHAYVIMSNHIHVIFSAEEGSQLSEIIRDFKRHTAKEILSILIEGKIESRSEWMLRLFQYYAKYNKNNKKYQIWKRDNRPTELASPKWINQKLAYIHQNPVRAGIVSKAEDYLYSSAGFYLSNNGILAVDIIDLGNLSGYVDS